MGRGLQVWNAAGQLVFDTPDRASRVIGSITVPAGTSGGSIALPTGYGDYWFHIQNLSGTRYSCNVSISGNTLTYGQSPLWTPTADCLVIYGAY